MKNTDKLIKYDAMVQAIEEAHAIDEVKDIRDKAKALEIYAIQAQNHDAEMKAYYIRMRAQKRMGALSKQLAKAKGNQHKVQCAPGAQSKGDQLAAAGVSREEASRAERLDEVPDEEFEAALASGEKPGVRALIEKHRKDTGPYVDLDHPDVVRLWGLLMDIMGHVHGRTVSDFRALSMSDDMAEDLDHYINTMRKWINED